MNCLTYKTMIRSEITGAVSGTDDFDPRQCSYLFGEGFDQSVDFSVFFPDCITGHIRQPDPGTSSCWDLKRYRSWPKFFTQKATKSPMPQAESWTLYFWASTFSSEFWSFWSHFAIRVLACSDISGSKWDLRDSSIHQWFMTEKTRFIRFIWHFNHRAHRGSHTKSMTPQSTLNCRQPWFFPFGPLTILEPIRVAEMVKMAPAFSSETKPDLCDDESSLPLGMKAA